MNNQRLAPNYNHNNAELGQLYELIAAREQWEANSSQKANQELYALLQKCAEFYDDYMQCESKTAWKNALKTVAKEKSITLTNNFRRNIVRVIFGFGKKNYRRISMYGLALDAARTAGVQASQVAQWMADKGGVTEVGRSSKKPIVRKAELVKQRLKVKLSLPSTELANLVDADQQGEYIVFLARVDNGTVQIFDISASATSVKATLNSLYTSYKNQPAEAETNPKVGKTAQEILAKIAQQKKLGEAA